MNSVNIVSCNRVKKQRGVLPALAKKKQIDFLALPEPAITRLLELLGPRSTVALALASRKHHSRLSAAASVYRVYQRFLRRFLWPTLAHNAASYVYIRPRGLGEQQIELELYTLKDEFVFMSHDSQLLVNAWLLGAPFNTVLKQLECIDGAWLRQRAPSDSVVRGFDLDAHSLLEYLGTADLVQVYLYAPDGPPRQALEALSIPVGVNDWATLEGANFWQLVRRVSDADSGPGG